MNTSNENSIGYFNSIRLKHKGKRGFIICNGPSLKAKDLDKLRNEITIASNLIYLIYEETDWRPTYYTVIDDLVWAKIAGKIGKIVKQVIASKNISPSLTEAAVYQFEDKGHAPYVENDLAFSGCLVDGLYGGSTVTYTNLQLARHLGLNPVYLIGCDHYYNEPSDTREGVPIQSSAVNHFSPRYRKIGELVNPAPIDNMTRSFEVALKYCNATDFIIYNATRGGKLEVFERVDFDSIARLF